MEALIDHEFYMTTYRGTKFQKVSNTRAGAPPLKIRKVEDFNVKVVLEELAKEEPSLCRQNLSITTFQKQTDTCCIESENEQTLKEFLQGVKQKKSKMPLACVVRSAPLVEDYSGKTLVPAKKRKRKRLRSTGELYSHAKLLDLTQEKDETLDEWLKRTSSNSRKGDSKDENRDVKVFERRKVRVNSLEGRKVKFEAIEGGEVEPCMGIHATQSSTKLHNSAGDIPSAVIKLEENEPQIFSCKGLRTSSSSILDVQEAVTDLKIPTLQSDCAQQAALRGDEVTQDMVTVPVTLLRCSEVEYCDNSSHTAILKLEAASEQSSETSVEVADALEGNVQIPALLEGVQCEMKQDEWRQSNSSKNLNAQFLLPMEDMLENEGECEIQQSACGTGNELLEVSETSEVMEVHLEDLALRSKPSDQCVNATAPSEVPFLQKYGDEQPRGALVTQMEAGTEMELDAYTQLETVIVADLFDAPIIHPVATETISQGAEEELGVVLESDSSVPDPSEISGLAAIPSALDVCSSAKLSSGNLDCSPKQKMIWEPRLKSASVGMPSCNDLESDEESNNGDAQGEGDECIHQSECDGEQDNLSLLTSINPKNSMGERSPCVDIVEEELTILEDKESRLKSASVGVPSRNDMGSEKEINNDDAQGEGAECIPHSEYDGEQDNLSLLTSINSKNSMGEISPCVDVVEEELTILEDKESDNLTKMSENVTAVTPDSIVSRSFASNSSSEDWKLGAANLPTLQPRCTVSHAEAPGQGDSARNFLGGCTSPQCCDDCTISVLKNSRKVKKRKATSVDNPPEDGSTDIHFKVIEDCASNTLEGTLSAEELPVLLEKEGLGLEEGHALDNSQEMSDRNGGSNACKAEVHNEIALDVKNLSTVSSEGGEMCQERDSLIDTSIVEGHIIKKSETSYGCLPNFERVRDDFEAEDILASEKMVMDLSPEIGSLVKSFTAMDIPFSEYSPEATQENDPTGDDTHDEGCWSEVTTCSSPAGTNEGFQGVDGSNHTSTEFLGSSGMKSAEEKGQCPDSPLPGPSKMPCKRKAISPRSQQELIRASRPQSGRIPFRIKLLKSFSKHESADCQSWSKESSQNFVLGNDDVNFSFGDSAFSESQDDPDHTEQDGQQAASLSPMSPPFSPPLQLTQNDPSNLSAFFSEDPLETIGCSNEHIAVGSPEHNKQPTSSHSTDTQHVLLQTTEESNVKLISFQESPSRMSNCSQLPISSGSPHTPVKSQESTQQIRSILKTSSLKRNIDVVPCQGSCKCPKCITSCEHSKTAIEFIASQMSFADRIAGRLIAEMTNMRNIMEEEHKSGSEGEQPASSSAPKKVALESAVKAQEWARKELLKMSRDSKRVCRLIDTGPRRIIFADEAGRRLCHVKFLPGKKNSEDSQLLA